MTSQDMVLVASYDYLLVALSVIIAVLASYAALDLARRVTSAQGKSRPLWLSGGAPAVGVVLSSIHYIRMLGFRFPMALQIYWPTGLLSLLAAILGSCPAVR